MLKMLSVIKRNLQNLRKSQRVVDESALPATTVNGDHGSNNGVMMKFPFSIMSCFAVPRVSRTDGLWVSGDYGRLSEVNHLMVCDGMRYALLMFILRYFFQATVYTLWQEHNRRRYGEQSRDQVAILKDIDRIVRNRVYTVERRGRFSGILRDWFGASVA